LTKLILSAIGLSAILSVGI